MRMSFDEEFERSRAMLILRGLSPQRSLELASLGWDAGVRLIEVPLQGELGHRSLEAVVEAGAERGLSVGAGTITDVDSVELAARLGAAFTVAPGWDPTVAERSEQLGLPHLPGVATATEVQAARRAGHVWLKAFPAFVLGVGWFEAMRGPFPGVKFVATGGVAPHDSRRYVDSGAAAVALGSAIADIDRATLVQLVRELH